MQNRPINIGYEGIKDQADFVFGARFDVSVNENV